MRGAQKKYGLFSEGNVVQFCGLLFSIIFVALVYFFIVRPQAEKVAMDNRVRAAQDAGKREFEPERNLFTIIKDEEQQVCFTLLLWAMIIMGHKLIRVFREEKVMGQTFLEIEEGERIIPEEALSHSVLIESAIERNPSLRDSLLPRVFLTALRRFQSTQSIQDVSQSVRELADSEAERLDSDLSLARYIAWAIPSVGFIGTVRGIGMALTKAEQAIRGDIQGVTENLGLAFNSTLIALFLSIILMYFIHILQSRQESFILHVEDHCRENLVALMKTPYREESELTYT